MRDWEKLRKHTAEFIFGFVFLRTKQLSCERTVAQVRDGTGEMEKIADGRVAGERRGAPTVPPAQASAAFW